MGIEQDRAGTIWCESDYALLFEALARQMSDEEVAEHVGRGLSAVRSRAHMLLDGATNGKTASLRMLRRMAAHADFDWDPFVREAHQRAKLPYWDTAADATLIEHWSAAEPPRMAQLCEQFGVTEEAIARRVLILGLAQTRLEVVDRFGAAEHGALYTHAVLARDKLTVTLGVLVLTDSAGEVVHLSLHPDPDLADRALRALPADTAPAGARWTVAARVVGEGSVRRLATGIWPPTTVAASGIPAAPESRWARLVAPIRRLRS